MEKRYEEAVSFDSIYEAFRYAKRGSYWKDSIIEYDINRLYYSVKISRQLKNRKYRLKGYYKFTIKERDKIRDIQSLHITDRVHQRALCDKIIIPTVNKTFVYDNGASQTGRGTNYCRDRLKRHLRDYYRKYGRDGYVLKIDIKKYFDNIPHNYLKQRCDKYFKGEIIADLAKIIDSYDGDKGIGLGSQISQIFALDALNSLDHFIKEKLQIKFFNRYMDDFYLIHPNKKHLEKCKEKIEKFLFNENQLELHPNKTCITPLKNGISYLGFHFYITKTGKIYCKLLNKSIRREKKKIRRMIKKGVSEKAVRKSFTSWKGYAEYGNSYYLIRKVEKYMERHLRERSLNNELYLCGIR